MRSDRHQAQPVNGTEVDHFPSPPYYFSLTVFMEAHREFSQNWPGFCSLPLPRYQTVWSGRGAAFTRFLFVCFCFLNLVRGTSECLRCSPDGFQQQKHRSFTLLSHLYPPEQRRMLLASVTWFCVYLHASPARTDVPGGLPSPVPPHVPSLMAETQAAAQRGECRQAAGGRNSRSGVDTVQRATNR